MWANKCCSHVSYVLVGLVLHEADEASVDALAAITAVAFILELTFLVPIELVFVHGESKPVN